MTPESLQVSPVCLALPSVRLYSFLDLFPRGVKLQTTPHSCGAPPPTPELTKVEAPVLLRNGGNEENIKETWREFLSPGGICVLSHCVSDFTLDNYRV